MISIIVGAGTLLAPGWGAYVSATTIFDLNVPLTIAFSALLFFLLSSRIPSLAASLALGTVGLTLHDVLGATGSAIRVAATVTAAGPVVAGTVGVARAASQAAGGGAIGTLKGMSAGVGALSQEALAASVPRLQQAGSHLQQQAREARARQRGGQQEDFIR